MGPPEERRNQTGTGGVLSVRVTHFGFLRYCGGPDRVPDGPSVTGHHLLESEEKP